MTVQKFSPQHLLFDRNGNTELTVPGQQADTRKVGLSDGLLVVTPGQEQQINLWQALRDSGAPVDQQAMVISSIRMEQALLSSCQTTTGDQEQILEVDYLRFVDVPSVTP
jgi:predicted exporter